MKKILIRALKFLVFFSVFSFLVNGVYLAVIMSTDWDFRKRIESMRFENPDFDMLILGSSIAQYGVDSELLTKRGIRSYNMALVGSSVRTYYVQLDEYLKKYPEKPQFIMLATNASLEEFDQKGIQPVVEFTMKGQKIDIKDLPVSKFRWQGTELFKKAFSKEYRRGHLSFGQLKRIKKVQDISVFKNVELNLEKYRKAFWIGELAELCAKENVKLLIIEVPGVLETRNSSGIGPYNISFVNGFKADLYNLNSREFCEYIDPENDWVGLSHFNEQGAAKFTGEMIKTIPFDNIHGGNEVISPAIEMPEGSK